MTPLSTTPPLTGSRRDPRSPAFESLADVMALVRRFENGTLEADRWDHRARLTVCLWYLLHYEECQATDLWIRAVRRYHRAHALATPSLGGYHETRTLFWLAVARRYLESHQSGSQMLDLLNGFLAHYGHRESLLDDHYRPETLQSSEACYFWVEPDLEPLG